MTYATPFTFQHSTTILTANFGAALLNFVTKAYLQSRE